MTQIKNPENVKEISDKGALYVTNSLKRIALLLMALIAIFVFSGCSAKEPSLADQIAQSKKEAEEAKQRLKEAKEEERKLQNAYDTLITLKNNAYGR